MLSFLVVLLSIIGSYLFSYKHLSNKSINQDKNLAQIKHKLEIHKITKKNLNNSSIKPPDQTLFPVMWALSSRPTSEDESSSLENNKSLSK